MMAQPKIEIDLKPAFTVEQLAAKIRHAQGIHLLDQATRAWRLSRTAMALLQLHAPFGSGGELAALAKAYPLALRGPRPIEEAISTAGGVSWEELDESLMLKRCPGIFCAGEMIDWDAPTGGYLIQGCFSTATRAARGVNQFLTGKHEDMKS
jgi:predicted flavoprotein YhiN